MDVSQGTILPREEFSFSSFILTVLYIVHGEIMTADRNDRAKDIALETARLGIMNTMRRTNIIQMLQYLIIGAMWGYIALWIIWVMLQVVFGFVFSGFFDLYSQLLFVFVFSVIIWSPKLLTKLKAIRFLLRYDSSDKKDIEDDESMSLVALHREFLSSLTSSRSKYDEYTDVAVLEKEIRNAARKSNGQIAFQIFIISLTWISDSITNFSFEKLFNNMPMIVLILLLIILSLWTRKLIDRWVSTLHVVDIWGEEIEMKSGANDLGEHGV